MPATGHILEPRPTNSRQRDQERKDASARPFPLARDPVRASIKGTGL